MRVALVTNEYATVAGAGGIGTYAYHLARGLAGLGHDVHVVTVGERGDRMEDGVQLHCVPPACLETCGLANMFPASFYSLTRSLATWTRLAELAEDLDFDVVDVADTLAEGLFNAVARAYPMCVRLQTPVELFVDKGLHDMKMTFDYWVLSRLERLCLDRAGVIVAASDYLRRYILQSRAIPAGKVELLRNPLDLSAVTGKLDYETNGTVRFFYAGRLEKLKGVHTLIEAFVQAAGQEPSFRLELVGSDTNRGVSGGSVRAELESILTKSGHGDRVQFTDRIDHRDLLERVGLADVVVVPSLYDNAPYACVEAMAAGAAVIGGDEGGMPEYLGAGERGLVFKAGDPASLAQAMVKAGRDAGLRRSMGRAAREWASENCHHLTVARQSVALYEKMVSGRSPADARAGRLRLAAVLAESHGVLSMFEEHCAIYGPVPAASRAYDEGYQSGLDDGKSAGYQSGFHDAVFSGRLVKGAFWLQGKLSQLKG